MKLLRFTGALFLQICSAYLWSSDQSVLHDDSLQLPKKDKLSDVIAESPFLSLHRALCEIESVTDNELAVADFLQSFLEARDFSVTTQRVPPPAASNTTKERLNVYAVPDVSKRRGLPAKGLTASPKVLLTSHIDTVPPHIPYSLSIPSKSKASRGEIMIMGRGTVDDKACVAAQMQSVLDLIADSNSGVDPRDLALLFVVGEEKRGDGMRHFSNSKLYKETNSDYKAILFGEPTEGKLATGHKGFMSLKINAQGKAAHSGYPWLGRSANSMILPALMGLDQLGNVPEEYGGLPRSKRYGKTTVNVGFMEGGVAGNVVPRHATADITFRLAGGTVEKAEKIVRDAISAADPKGLLELDFNPGYGPVPLDADVEGFGTISVNYGTDVPNIVVAKGVKRYLYGPGSILVAHGDNEGLSVADMEEALEGYKTLIKHVLKQ